MDTNNTSPGFSPSFRVNDRIIWFLGPRKLRRSGQVVGIYRDGLEVKRDGNGELRRVLWSASPQHETA